MEAKLTFLKLGGSLITEKTRPHTARSEVLARLAEEIAAARKEKPGQQILLGHGSGSFGHVPARRWGTRDGVRGDEAWRGFIEVWREAATLNRLVLQALEAAGLPALVFPPSACVVAEDGRPECWEVEPIQAALQAGLLPVVYGDAVFDRIRGGTILSTEDLFEFLAQRLRPRRILQAGLEAGVWEDYPACTRLIQEITPENLKEVERYLGGSAAEDVTGGMASKVHQSLAVTKSIPGLEVHIFSGVTPGSVFRALLGEPGGTTIRSHHSQADRS